MAKWWREQLDADKHRDHSNPGSPYPVAVPRDRLIPAWAYFVEVCGFTFEFVSLAQVRDCLNYYSTPILPSSREPVFEPEKGDWQPWYERLPLHLREEPKRQKVVHALSRASLAFANMD